MDAETVAIAMDCLAVWACSKSAKTKRRALSAFEGLMRAYALSPKEFAAALGCCEGAPNNVHGFLPPNIGLKRAKLDFRAADHAPSGIRDHAARIVGKRK
jgi:hypothetical protein